MDRPSRVFVIGTGRCGTTTFARACEAGISNFTAGHETRQGFARLDEKLDYPAGHIESDPHLAWCLPILIERFPDAYYVHLQRDRAQVIASWLRRPSNQNQGIGSLTNIILQSQPQFFQFSTTPRKEDLAGSIFDIITSSIEFVLSHSPVVSKTMYIDTLAQDFTHFWEWIGAEGALEMAVRTAAKKHNRS